MSRTVLQHGSHFDSIKANFISDQTIVIDQGIIKWVGNYADFEKESDDNIIDLSNKTVLPGLFDCHVHLEGNHKSIVDFNNYLMRHKDSYIGYLTLKHAQSYLQAGVTTVRDCGSFGEIPHTASLKKITEEKTFIGPRIKAAQHTISQFGDQEMFGPNWLINKRKDKSTISGIDGVIHAVRDRKASGSDFIKTMTTGGVLHGQESKLDRSLWREEELSAMVSEAERLGMYVAAHAHTNTGMYQAAKCGVRTIEHGSLPTEETIDMMVKMKSYLIPTHAPAHLIKSDKSPFMKQLPPEVIEKARQVSYAKDDLHKLAFEKGVIFGLGTDAPVMGEHCHTGFEIELMVTEVGMSIEEALQCGTINSAKAIRLDDISGSLEVGKFADIVVVDAPLIDNVTILQDLTKLEYVFKEGKIVSQKGQLIHS